MNQGDNANTLWHSPKVVRTRPPRGAIVFEPVERHRRWAHRARNLFWFWLPRQSFESAEDNYLAGSQFTLGGHGGDE